MSSTTGPSPADQPDKHATASGSAGPAGDVAPGGAGAAAKSGPPSEDLDVFPTLEDNTPASDVPRDGDVSRTQVEVERTAPVDETQPAASDPAGEKTSVVPASNSISGSSANPPMSVSEGEPTTQESMATRPMETPSAVAAKPVSPHVRDLIKAGLFTAATRQAAGRGAFAVVEGRYELRETLGEGGMGLVFLAYDNVGDCLVAVKTLKPSFLNSAKSRTRFIEEAKEMNRIPAHACVLVVKDFGSLEKPFYVTEYLVGGSVGGAIRFQGPLPPDLARRYATNIATAIAYIHAKRGKLHRDIKPENVLIDDDGSARLADFGLVWQIGEGSRGMRAGTVPYMPPEVVGDQRKNVGYEWDVYSFGATLYEMLTGHAPYADLLKREIESTGKTRLEVLRHLVSQMPPTPILSCNKNADKHLARIAEWAMARDARDRYFHVDHILADLDRLGQGKKPMGPQQTEGCERNERWCLIRRVLAASVLGMAAVGGLIWFFLPDSSVGPTPPDPQDSAVVAVPALDANADTAASPVTDGPMFDQSRTVSPLNLTFQTVDGVKRFRAAPAGDWALIEGRRFEYESDMPWKPAADQAITFRARTDRPAYLTILMREADGGLTQLLPNSLEMDHRLEARRDRLVPRPFSAQEYSYWFRVTPPAGTPKETKAIKAIITERPFQIAGVSEADIRDQGFPTVPRDFRVVVDGQTYDSFEAVFGDRWQTVDLTLEVVK